jgi:hypothetical protein
MFVLDSKFCKPFLNGGINSFGALFVSLSAAQAKLVVK